MYKFLFIDLDDTILDFGKAEERALRKTLQDAGLEPTEAVCRRYSLINKAHWERLERGELTRDQVLVGRFRVLFEEMGCSADPQTSSLAYMQNLGIGHDFLPGALEAVISLSKKYKLYIASNGTASVQEKRLKSADIGKYFQEIFISQEIGFNKPAVEFFQGCFARIPDLDKAQTMIVGDSLTSDILGGQNAGIATCWVNPGHKECTLAKKPDYEIESLSQLEALLESI